MPGLIGFTTAVVAPCRPAAVIAAMQESLVHRPFHFCDAIYGDSSICASQVHLTATGRNDRPPCSCDEVFVWCDGECYNKEKCGGTGMSDARLILEHYRCGTLGAFLKAVDGIFTAVIYDRTRRTITIVNDRFGFRYLYVYVSPAGCAWASELKAFRQLPSKSFQIDRDAAALFFAQGYLSGNRTWFREIELLAPGSLLTIECDSGRVNTSTWADANRPIPAKVNKLDVTAYVRELGELFKNAVNRRCHEGERISLGLSGGLDSRAIFAAMPLRCEPLNTFTFGARNCTDLYIARNVTALRPSTHRFFELSADNWLTRRTEAVWWTDGQLNLLDMHGVEYCDAIRELGDISLNGFIGDALLGACDRAPGGEERSRFMDRDRRCIAMGIYLAGQSGIIRLPFFDTTLMELVGSIPLRYRRHGRFYHRMLCATFPVYFQDIPWQNTGAPISRDDPLTRTGQLMKKCMGLISARVPLPFGTSGYTDYAAWIRQDPGRDYFTGLLTNKKAVIYDYADRECILRQLGLHMRGFDYKEQLGRYVTFELWLRRWNAVDPAK